MYSRLLTGLAPNIIQVVQGFSASHGPSFFTQRVHNRQISLQACEQLLVSIFFTDDTAIIAIGGYAKIGGVSQPIARLAHVQWR